ncbi:MAG TPA: helix-turn-helix domain-containing protein [Pirellulales bacterium]|nr:helix-turn-helix domain-containing protein [Pirellulales bacterium]
MAKKQKPTPRSAAQTSDDNAFGRRLRALRQARRLSLNQLAGASRLTRNTLIKLEQGQRKDPQLSTLAALCRGLACSPDELVGRQV